MQASKPKNVQPRKSHECSQVVKVRRICPKLKMDKLERLKKLYYDPKEPGSFGGVKRLSEASGLKKSHVRKFLP
ncbi:hypothetical protein CEXT_535001 [Caerostris extrusa]|uniref:Uncharacterized protein n=1 Tax=Caerostris extrusa TaxID=172846 RepID=A0AAV4P727_CAEEX|nr:hypothetical protein CEXT_535001 [Caerostris extrusa]